MNEQFSKHDHVLLSLTMNLQTMAMVQLGKVSNPATGETELDLEAARSTIDILEMLKAKCRTDTPEAALKMLEQAVMDLQMNYLDEIKRDRKSVDTDADGDADTDETEDPTPEDTDA